MWILQNGLIDDKSWYTCPILGLVEPPLCLERGLQQCGKDHMETIMRGDFAALHICYSLMPRHMVSLSVGAHPLLPLQRG